MTDEQIAYLVAKAIDGAVAILADKIAKLEQRIATVEHVLHSPHFQRPNEGR